MPKQHHNLNFFLAFENVTKKSKCQFCIIVCMKLLVDNNLLMYSQCWVLKKSLGSHGNSSLLFVMKMIGEHIL
jgi:hypothetical protein